MLAFTSMRHKICERVGNSTPARYAMLLSATFSSPLHRDTDADFRHFFFIDAVISFDAAMFSRLRATFRRQLDIAFRIAPFITMPCHSLRFHAMLALRFASCFADASPAPLRHADMIIYAMIDAALTICAVFAAFITLLLLCRRF